MKKIFVLIGLLLFVSFAYAQEDETVWMPDPNLRHQIREHLKLPENFPLTKIELKRLTHFDDKYGNIRDITGLEHATYLEHLDLESCEILDLKPFEKLTTLEHLRVLKLDRNDPELTDITPLSYLTQLTYLDLNGNAISDIIPLANLTQLTYLDLGRNDVSDITSLANLIQLQYLDLRNNHISDIIPLANLTRLTYLDLGRNAISDITSLANLIQLQYLDLRNNHISDIIPLANLIQLETLILTNNILVDFTAVGNLPLKTFEHDWICDVPMKDVASRLQERNFPAHVHVWNIRLEEEYGLEHPKVGLFFGPYWYKLDRIIGADIVQYKESSEEFVMSRYEQFRIKNPDVIHLIGMLYREAWHTQFPEDSPYWLRGKNGERLRSVPGEPTNLSYYIDFTKPETIDFIVQQAVAVARCGLFDGIVFDWWTDYHAILKDRSQDGRPPVHGVEVEQNARDEILRRIRAEVPEDFIIIGNGNRGKNMRTAWACNGSTMELGLDYPGGYTHAGLSEIDDALFWISENMREPRVNAVHFNAIEDQPYDSPDNLQMMRCCTTLILTMSNAFFSFRKEYSREYRWYDFWDTDLGKPIGEKRQRYENKDGLFIREFTNGWVVYNRSYASQKVLFSEPVASVTSGIHAWQHAIPDLDGDIYLKIDGEVSNPADLNGDGVVNILDLVIVANRLNTAKPDLNGDGVVNILDLVIVAKGIQSEDATD